MDLELDNSLLLYKRLTPCLNCKLNELIKCNMDYIKKGDIWNYLLTNKWNDNKKITLGEMVDDILNLDNDKLDRFVKEKLKGVKEDILNDKIELL